MFDYFVLLTAVYEQLMSVFMFQHRHRADPIKV